MRAHPVCASVCLCVSVCGHARVRKDNNEQERKAKEDVPQVSKSETLGLESKENTKWQASKQNTGREERSRTRDCTWDSVMGIEINQPLLGGLCHFNALPTILQTTMISKVCVDTSHELVLMS